MRPVRHRKLLPAFASTTTDDADVDERQVLERVHHGYAQRAALGLGRQQSRPSAGNGWREKWDTCVQAPALAVACIERAAPPARLVPLLVVALRQRVAPESPIVSVRVVPASDIESGGERAVAQRACPLPRTWLPGGGGEAGGGRPCGRAGRGRRIELRDVQPGVSPGSWAFQQFVRIFCQETRSTVKPTHRPVDMQASAVRYSTPLVVAMAHEVFGEVVVPTTSGLLQDYEDVSSLTRRVAPKAAALALAPPSVTTGYDRLFMSVFRGKGPRVFKTFPPRDLLS